MAYGSALVDTIQSSTTGTPPQFNDGSGAQIGTLCRAWVNFNGTSGASPVIRASFNVSSVTRASAGQYTITFSTAMSDANYATTFGTASNLCNFGATYTASTVTLSCATYLGAANDPTIATISVFR